MKKALSIILVLLLTAVMITGCEDKNKSAEEQPPVQQEKKAEHKETVEEKQPDVTDGTATAEAVPPSPTDETVTGTEYIGEDKAKEIVLKKAGISSDGVVFDRVELDYDDGIWEYEVDFRQGRTEYDAEINAKNGAIISWEVDIDD